MLPFPCLLAVLFVAAASAQDTSSSLQTFEPRFYHEDIRADETIFLYNLNRIGNECEFSKASYFRNKPFGDFYRSSTIRCKGQDGLKFIGTDRPLDYIFEGVRTNTPNPGGKRFIQSTLSPKINNVQHFRFGIDLVSSEGNWSKPGAAFGVDPPEGDVPWYTDLFSIGPALKVMFTRDPAREQPEKSAIVFKMRATDENGKTVDIILGLPEVKSDGLEVKQRSAIEKSANSVSHIIAAVTLKDMKTTLEYEIKVINVGTDINAATIITPVTGSIAKAEGAGHYSFFDNYNIDYLWVGANAIYSAVNLPAVYQNVPFRGHLHQLGLFALRDDDSDMRDFLEQTKARAIAYTLPRMLPDQLIKLPLRAKESRIPFVFSTNPIVAMGPSNFTNALAFNDLDIPIHKPYLFRVPYGNSYYVRIAGESSQSETIILTRRMTDQGEIIFNSNIDIEKLEQKSNVMSHHKPENCTSARVAYAAKAIIQDERYGDEKVEFPFGICFYDRRVKAYVKPVSRMVTENSLWFAQIQLDDSPNFNYYILIDTTEFVPGSFGVLKDNTCEYFQDENLLVHNGHQLIKWDNPDGHLDLCMNVRGFRNFDGDSEGINIFVARYRDRGSEKPIYDHFPGSTGTFGVDVSDRWVSRVHYRIEQVVAMINEVNNPDLNMHISTTTRLKTNVTELTPCYQEDCLRPTVTENKTPPSKTTADAATNSVAFRLSMGVSGTFLPSRSVLANHKFAISKLPDPSQGILYFASEDGNVDKRVPVSLNADGFAIIPALEFKTEEAWTNKDAIVTNMFEFEPAMHYFNVILNEKENKQHTFATSQFTGMAMGGCADLKNGCPVQIEVEYYYEGKNVTSPDIRFAFTVEVDVIGQTTFLTEDMLVVPLSTKAAPLTQAADEPMSFINELAIEVAFSDEDLYMITVLLRSTSNTDKFVVQVDDSLQALVAKEFLRFEGEDCYLAGDCSTITMTGYPSMINMVLGNMTWQSPGGATELQIELIKIKDTISRSVFVNVVGPGSMGGGGVFGVAGDMSTVFAIVGSLVGVGVLAGGLVVARKYRNSATSGNQQNKVVDNAHRSTPAPMKKTSTMMSPNPSFISV